MLSALAQTSLPPLLLWLRLHAATILNCSLLYSLLLLFLLSLVLVCEYEEEKESNWKRCLWWRESEEGRGFCAVKHQLTGKQFADRKRKKTKLFSFSSSASSQITDPVVAQHLSPLILMLVIHSSMLISHNYTITSFLTNASLNKLKIYKTTQHNLLYSIHTKV